MQDPFIREHIEDLLRNVRTQVLCKLIKPYSRIRIPFISKVSKNLYSGKKVEKQQKKVKAKTLFFDMI